VPPRERPHHQGMSDHDGRCGVRRSQIVCGADEVLDVGAETGGAEIEVETQDRDTDVGQSSRDPRRGHTASTAPHCKDLYCRTNHWYSRLCTAQFI
jgi:hypothetical protein